MIKNEFVRKYSAAFSGNKTFTDMSECGYNDDGGWVNIRRQGLSISPEDVTQQRVTICMFVLHFLMIHRLHSYAFHVWVKSNKSKKFHEFRTIPEIWLN